MSAWDKLTPLERKLELKRRARVRRQNRKARLLAAALEHVSERPGAALVTHTRQADAG